MSNITYNGKRVTKLLMVDIDNTPWPEDHDHVRANMDYYEVPNSPLISHNVSGILDIIAAVEKAAKWCGGYQSRIAFLVEADGEIEEVTNPTLFKDA